MHTDQQSTPSLPHHPHPHHHHTPHQVLDFYSLNRNLTSREVPSNVNVFAWWRENEAKYPGVAAVARRYLAIPATSVESERVFSIMGIIFNKKRARLKGDMAEAQILLHAIGTTPSLRAMWEKVCGYNRIAAAEEARRKAKIAAEKQAK